MKLFVLNALVSLFVVAVGIAAYHHTVRSPADRIGVIDVTEVYRLKEKEFTDLVTKAGASESDKDKAMAGAEAFARARGTPAGVRLPGAAAQCDRCKHARHDRPHAGAQAQGRTVNVSAIGMLLVSWRIQGRMP
jgi:hypothetical protein